MVLLLSLVINLIQITTPEQGMGVMDDGQGLFYH